MVTPDYDEITIADVRTAKAKLSELIEWANDDRTRRAAARFAFPLCELP